MATIIRRGQEADLPALRDILNHYILNTVVTFEMVELSLENRKTWFTQFRDEGRYQLMVAEKDGQTVGYAASLRFQLDGEELSLESPLPDELTAVLNKLPSGT